jgi:enoyl-CoA hydratase
LPAERAYALGLVNRLVEPERVLNEAIALAETVCRNAPLAVWASRKVVLASQSASETELIALTNSEFGSVLSSEDTKEGLSAFIEKRAPNWRGR